MSQLANRLVDFGDGTIAVRDHGGEGPTVLLVHALGMCAVNWQRVAVLLRESCRVLAMDYPGHGQSTASMRTPYAVFECVLAVARALRLPPALVVGHDHGALVMAEAVTAAPELFTGGVAIGGSIARTREEMQLMCDVASSEFFMESMRTRFRFGARGEGPLEAEELIDDVVGRASEDWILRSLTGLREERAYCIRYLDATHWVHQPDPEDVAMVGRFPSSSPYFPSIDLAAGYQVPVWMVQLSHGQDVQLADRERELASQHEQLRVLPFRSGQWPQYTRPGALARLIHLIAHDPAGDPAQWEEASRSLLL